MNEIIFKKLPKHIYYILFITSSIIGVFLIFSNPLEFSSSYKIKGLYILPLLLFIWLWKNSFFLYKNYVRWNDDLIWIKVNRTNTITINFKEILGISFEQSNLLIFLKNNKKEIINLENISSVSKEKLKTIFKTNSKSQL